MLYHLASRAFSISFPLRDRPQWPHPRYAVHAPVIYITSFLICRFASLLISLHLSSFFSHPVVIFVCLGILLEHVRR